MTPFIRKRRAGIWAACCALALSACAQTGQQATLDTAVTAERLSLPPGQSAAISTEWWLALHQPTLNQLLQQGLAQAPDVRTAQARLQLAEAQWRGAAGQAGVQIGIQANGDGIYLDPKPGVPDKQPNHVLTSEMAAMAVNYSFDFWGKQHNSIQAALGQRQAAQWQVAQARLVLAQAIVAQYTQWQLLDAQLAVVSKRIVINKQLQDLLAQRIRAGLLPGSAAYTQNQALLSLQAAQKQLQAERERTEHSLAALTGQPPTALHTLTPQALGATPPVVVNGLRADILGQRPDIAAQRALLQSRYFGVQAAKAEFYPNIEIKGLAGFSHVDAFDLLHSSSRILGLMPAITLPIFTSGSLRANLAGKHAQYNEQVAVYDKTVITALQQAADAISDYQHSHDAMPLQRQAWQVAQKNAQSSARRMRAGLDNGLNRWSLEDAALSAQIDYLKATAWQQQSWNNLQAALGGGFADPTATTTPQP